MTPPLLTLPMRVYCNCFLYNVKKSVQTTEIAKNSFETEFFTSCLVFYNARAYVYTTYTGTIYGCSMCVWCMHLISVTVRVYYFEAKPLCMVKDYTPDSIWSYELHLPTH